jgi:hypothetical protein
MRVVAQPACAQDVVALQQILEELGWDRDTSPATSAVDVPSR